MTDSPKKAARSAGQPTSEVHEAEGRRAYITATLRVRLHQRDSENASCVPTATNARFAAFGHRDLLDAAHIIGDSESTGEPVVTNGLSLCKIHHAAFDRFIIGIRPDFTVEVHPKVLKESDGADAAAWT